MKRQFLSILFILLTVSCAHSKGNNKPEPPEPQYETITYTLDFNSSWVSRSNTESSGFLDSLKSYVNHDTEILQSVTNNGYANIYGKGNDDINRLIVGSATQNGELVFTFIEQLVSLTINGQAQYSSFRRNWVEYDDNLEEKPQGYILNNDNTANILTVNGAKWDITEKVGETVYQTQEELDAAIPEHRTKTFDIKSNTLSLKGLAAQRVQIYSLSFTFYDLNSQIEQ